MGAGCRSARAAVCVLRFPTGARTIVLAFGGNVKNRSEAFGIARLSQRRSASCAWPALPQDDHYQVLRALTVVPLRLEWGKHMPPNGRDRDRLSIRQGRQSQGFLFGLIAGATLLVTVWGIDAMALHRAGALLPWARLVFAALCILLPFGAIGWLSTYGRSTILSGLLWLAVGLGFGWFAAQVTFRFLPWAIAEWAPGASRFLSFEYSVGPSTRALLSSIICGVIFFFAGVMCIHLEEGASVGAYPASRWLSVIAWIAFFAVSGAAVDSLLHQPLRSPATAVHDLISFRTSSPEAMETDEAKRLHARVLNPLEDLLSLPYRIVVAGYDETMTFVRVVVVFDGIWARCTMMATQPIFCEPLD